MKVTLKDRILEALKEGQMSDRALTDKLLGYGQPQQGVNVACRQLAAQGYLRRSPPPILNSLLDNPANADPPALPANTPPERKKDRHQAESVPAFQEESLKHVLDDWLQSQGWKTQVAWGGQHGIDINAWRGSEHWGIEVKGCGSRPEMRVNYFIGILGELLQRMDDPNARYSIALPDMQQFRTLWARLPWLAKERTNIDAVFVSEDGSIHIEK